MVQFSGFASLVLCIQTRIPYQYGGFPHSDIAGSLLFCQLLRAFRRLTRPSSPIIAKASTWCTYSLDSIIWKIFWLCKRRRWRPYLLRFPTLIKLTACCCVLFLPFVFQEQVDTIITQIWCWFVLHLSYQWFFHYSFGNFLIIPWECFMNLIGFSGCLKCCCISISDQINHCLCLLISAFQFVKDRCVVNRKLK